MEKILMTHKTYKLFILLISILMIVPACYMSPESTNNDNTGMINEPPISEPVSSIATINSSIYTVSTNGTSNESITNVPFGTAKEIFLANLTKGELNQTWDDTKISPVVLSDDVLTVTAHDTTTIVTYTVTVLSEPIEPVTPDVISVAADKEALTDDLIKGINTDLEHIIEPLTDPLPTEGANGSTITWRSENNIVVSDDGQIIIRPLFNEKHATVTLIATIVKGKVSDTKRFSLTVLNIPASAIATVFSSIYAVSAGGTENETITNVPFNTSKETFLSNLTKGNLNQVLDDTGISSVVLSGEVLVVTAQDNTTVVTYTITVLADELHFTSDLPIVIIDTYSKTILDEPKIPGMMKIIYNGDGVVNKQTDTPIFSQLMDIEIRGNSSQTFPKKQYGFETPADVSILGFPKETDWILGAPYSDKTLMRNDIAYSLSRQMGRYASRVKFVEAFIDQADGSLSEGISNIPYADLMKYYSGVYTLMEKIKRGSNRVNVKKMDNTKNEYPGVSGGYILKIDKLDSDEAYFNTSGGVRIIHVYPKAADVTVEQKAWISNYINQFETALLSEDFANPETGYAKFIDVDSFVDYFLINELLRNVDAYRISTYMYKNLDGQDKDKLNMGPVWDFDLSMGNCNYYDGRKTDGWSFKSVSVNDSFQVPFWWSRLFEDANFADKVSARWKELRGNIFSDDNLASLIDNEAALLEEAQVRNFERWLILGTYVWPNVAPYPATYAEEITALQTWISGRLSWIDTAVETLGPPPPSCDDNIQNQDEDSIDCGGVCGACPVSGEAFTKDFENGILSGLEINYGPLDQWSVVDDLNNNGLLQFNGAAYGQAVLKDAVWSDVEITAKANILSGQRIGLVFRYNDVNNFWRLMFEDGHAMVRGRINGTWVNASGDSNVVFAPTYNTWYNIKVRCEDSSIKAKWWVGGDVEPDWFITASDSILLEGSIGFAGTGNMFFDDLNITPLSALPPPIEETCSDGIQNQDETGVDCGGSCAACAPISTGGVSEWYFNEGAGITAEDSVGANDGVISNATWISGLHGSALHFDGLSGKVQIPDSETTRVTDNFSISVWIKTSQTSSYRYIIDKWWYQSDSIPEDARSWALNFENGQLVWRGTNNAKDSGLKKVSYDFSSKVGKWTHIVGTYDGTQLTLYVDGSKVGTQALSGITSSSKPIFIGAGNDGSLFYFNGDIDEVALFNTALSDNEVLTLYQKYGL